MAGHGRKDRLWDFLERGLFGELAVPALAASLVLFVSAMGLLGANVSELKRAYDRMQQSNAALVNIAMINTDVLRVDMIARGYALTPDPIYPKWKQQADQHLRERVSALELLFARDPVESANVKTLRGLVLAHIAYFDRLMALSRTDKAAMTAEILEFGKKWKRGPIERLLANMSGSETKQIALQRRVAEARVVSAYFYAIGIAGAALILGVMGFAVVFNCRRTASRV